MERFGWTYDEYRGQPQFILDLIHEKLRIDGEKSKIEVDKAKRG